MKHLFIALFTALFSVAVWASPYEVTEANNYDIIGGVERFDKVIGEIAQSESADGGANSSFDRTRIDSYNAALRAYMATIASQTGQVDLPHSYPTLYPIEYWSNTLDVQVRNPSVRNLLVLYMQGMEQLSKSASAGHSNGITPHDYQRFLMIMDKIENFLTDYIDQATPIDMPLWQQWPWDVTNPTNYAITAQDRREKGPLAVPRQIIDTEESGGVGGF